MTKTCIICGKAAGSAEHIFPAALGGRRTNKGIYCGPHNNGFSGLAGVITAQLKVINALLAVRQDHSKKAEPFEYISPQGENLVVFDGSVKRAPSNTAKSGPLHIHMAVGGDDGLKAIAYIALTFFAHFFQEHARKPGLQPIKDFLTGQSPNDFAWWEEQDILLSLPQNKFEFGHTIAVTTSTSGGARAFVSLFGSLNFGVALGDVEGLSDETVVTFIDPHADHPPDDIHTIKINSVLFRLVTPMPLQAHLEKTIRQGLGQELLEGLFQKIDEWKFGKEMAPVLERLNDVRASPANEQRAVIETIVLEQTQRVYRIMHYLADGFAAKHKSTVGADRAIPDHIISILKEIVEPTKDAKPTLGPKGLHVMTLALDALADDLAKKLANDEVDMDYLWRLFSGGHGAGIVGAIMFGLV